MYQLMVMVPLRKRWEVIQTFDSQKDALHRLGDYTERGGRRIKTLLPNRVYEVQISGPYWAKYKVVPSE